MAVNVTLRLKSAVFNSVTYNATSGGTQTLSYTLEGPPVRDRSGVSKYATFVGVPSIDCDVTLTLREVKQTIVPGTSSSLVCVVSDDEGNDTTLTFASMKYLGARGSQNPDTPGSVDLQFTHVSSDGTTVPLS